jgi:hypothetical protein
MDVIATATLPDGTSASANTVLVLAAPSAALGGADPSPPDGLELDEPSRLRRRLQVLSNINID